MTFSAHVTVASNELHALQAAMRDAQTAAADYYGQTARNDSIDDRDCLINGGSGLA